MKRTWIATAAAIAVTGTVLTGCGDAGSGEQAQELKLYFGDDVPTLDVSQATDSYSFDTLSNTMEGLVRLDKDGQAIPGMATKWDISEDGKVYTFELRDAKWSNGDAVTAKDFEYSWKRTLDPATASQYAFMLNWVKGATNYNMGKATADEVGVKALDDKKLQVTLENPTPFFLNQMAFPTFFPLNQKFVEEKGKKFGSSPDNVLANGPFAVTTWQTGEAITIEKNASYWDAATVKMNKIVFQVVKDSNTMVNMYESGELDRTSLIKEHYDRYKDNAEEFSVQPELTNGYLIFNPTVKGLDNAKIRTALTYAVDRDMYADIVYHNGTVGATGFVPTGTGDSAGHDFRKAAGELIKTNYDASEAKKALEEGLKETGMTVDQLRFELLVDDTDIAKKAAEFLQEQWRSKLGVTVEVQSVPFKLRLDKENKKDYQIGISLWGADYNDAMTFLDLFVSTAEFNKVGYNNPAYDKLVAEAKASVDKNQRAQLMMDAEKLMLQDMPVGPLFFRGKGFATKPYVKGLITFPFGVTHELKYTYIEGK
ncbi:peptide ABC transporter substrate-binding protein [Tumebacillus sp. DT12]|uniref:Peptide ABC transporter substrate-binding protein n=1 Tax=Tumebacillus lacus TaxID=2995335 RepID=A0ABT3WZ69_9BACL|nr:peptide ABC transporter substrate-binding protein [Tumebacillus lacus]MCX7569953.1 peptide ABC transporter substrate-binding protein [Tumebacillus lacus]